MAIEDFIQFSNTTYTYPVLSWEIDDAGNPIMQKPVFQNFTANLQGEFVSLVGPNASGKSTLMLLASGRLCPQEGSIKLFGEDTKQFFTPQEFDTGKGFNITLDVANPQTETKKNLLASFVYQNMEFQTDDKVGFLLENVFANGGYGEGASILNTQHPTIQKDFFDQVIKVAQLDSVLNKKLNGISKGETQRVLYAFSLLYGSRSIFMDEPFFAMEPKQKESVLDFLRNYSIEQNIPVYISMHELDLSKKYAQKILLFYPNRDLDYGSPEEVLTKEALEKSYGVPVAMLKDAESLTRKNIVEKSKISE